MNWTAILAWGTVVLGLALSVLSIRSTLYFRRHGERLGWSWVVVAFYRTSLTITIIAAYFTAARVFVLLTEPQPWLSVVSGLAIIWLLLIPAFLRELFRSHEGGG